MAEVIDMAEVFAPHAVGSALAKLWVTDGSNLVPKFFATGLAAECPITLEPIARPVLLSDGKIYEEMAIARWLQNSDRSPCTNLSLAHRALLRLGPLRVMVESFLQHNAGEMETPSKSLQRVLQKAQTSSGTDVAAAHVECLEAGIAKAAAEVEELQEVITFAQEALTDLNAKIKTSSYATRIQRFWRDRTQRRRRMMWTRTFARYQCEASSDDDEPEKDWRQLRQSVRARQQDSTAASGSRNDHPGRLLAEAIRARTAQREGHRQELPDARRTCDDQRHATPRALGSHCVETRGVNLHTTARASVDQETRSEIQMEPSQCPAVNNQEGTATSINSMIPNVRHAWAAWESPSEDGSETAELEQDWQELRRSLRENRADAPDARGESGSEASEQGIVEVHWRVEAAI
eukprot:TRINITY_DN47974_c0_g1_i1.p1 TRINITY_DN47974_c0_g1~~TRINITY_DN47974_c0_g1_i1.p1  ORF type:complete len:406 (-),score=62.12 TRINITY_DN47974_c0_g1_i1:97-1314(-)